MQSIHQHVVDSYFGTTFKRYEASLNAILACTSLDRFQSARSAIPKEDIDAIFHNCTTRDTLSAQVGSPKECRGLFLRLKTVSQNSDFI
jgi:hypothetical protein